MFLGVMLPHRMFGLSPQQKEVIANSIANYFEENDITPGSEHSFHFYLRKPRPPEVEFFVQVPRKHKKGFAVVQEWIGGVGQLVEKHLSIIGAAS